MNWEIMLEFAKFLDSRTWIADIANLLKEEFGSDMFWILKSALHNAAMSEFAERCSRRYPEAACSVQQSTQHRLVEAKIFFWEIMEDVRDYQATDFRDIIYAPLALAMHLYPILRLECPQPDNHKPVGDVFREMSAFFYEMFLGQTL